MTNEHICRIVGAGEFFGMDRPEQGDFVIAADRGLMYLQELGITPDLVIGDFDSLGNIPRFENIIVLPCEKDDTDTGAAVAEGICRGYKNFVLYGASGGRIDHTIANIQLISSLSQRGMRAVINAGETSYTSITDGGLRFGAQSRGYISVFSHSDISYGVTLKGLKYPLDDYTLKNTAALGVSNEFCGVESEIAVAHGTLTVIYPTAYEPEFFSC